MYNNDWRDTKLTYFNITYHKILLILGKVYKMYIYKFKYL